MRDNAEKYLSRAAITAATVKKTVLTLLGGLLSAFFLIGLILCLTDESIRSDWWAAVVILIPSLWMLWCGIRNRREIELARRYQSIFAAATNGVLTLDELCRMTGKSGVQISRELEDLFRRRFFLNCSLRREPFAVLLRGGRKGEGGFVTVECPHCGGSTRLRAGSSGSCDYCGSAIQAE